jgi:hypothetical protein
MTVLLSRSDVLDVRLRVAPRFHLPVILEGAPSEGVSLQLVPISFTFEEIQSLRRQPDGAAGINDLAPGRYSLKVRAVPANYYLEAIFLGEQGVLGRDVDLSEGGPPIRLVFKPNPVTARGTVENGPNTHVVFLPEEESLRGDYSIRTAVADASGRYGITGLRPGTYYVFAFDRLRSMWPLSDPVLVQSLEPRAVRVEVRKGESPAVDLKVTPWPQ